MNASVAVASTSPADDADVVNPSIDDALTLALAVASRAAYCYFKKQPVIAPGGYAQVDEWTGWDAILSGGTVESYGLVFQSLSDTGTFIFAFRGTDSDLDAWEDVHFLPADFVPTHGELSPTPRVSCGFYGIYDSRGGAMSGSMREQLFALLERYRPARLYITGHSLGAALSQLFSLDVAVSWTPSLSAFNTNFASPMVGFDSWASAYASRIEASQSIRVYNYLDYVPTLPPSLFDYRAVGIGFRTAFHVDHERLPRLAERHALLNLTYVLRQALPLSPQQWAGVFANQVPCEPDLSIVSTDPPTGADVRWADHAAAWMEAEAAKAG